MPKFVRGLGFKRMFDVNQALFAKIAWSVAASHEKLWVHLLHANYLNRQPFLTSDTIPSNSFWISKDAMTSKGLILQGACNNISINSTLRTWDDPWIPTLHCFKPTINPHNTIPLTNLNLIRSLMISGSNLWNISLLFELFPPEVVKEIRKIHILQYPSLLLFSRLPPC